MLAYHGKHRNKYFKDLSGIEEIIAFFLSLYIYVYCVYKFFFNYVLLLKIFKNYRSMILIMIYLQCVRNVKSGN